MCSYDCYGLADADNCLAEGGSFICLRFAVCNQLCLCRDNRATDLDVLVKGNVNQFVAVLLMPISACLIL